MDARTEYTPPANFYCFASGRGTSWIQISLLAVGAAVGAYGILSGGILADSNWHPLFALQTAAIFATAFLMAALVRLSSWPPRAVSVTVFLIGTLVVFGPRAVAGVGLVVIAALPVGALWLSGPRSPIELADVPLALLLGFASIVLAAELLVQFPVNSLAVYFCLLLPPIVVARKHLVSTARLIFNSLRAPLIEEISYWLWPAVLALLAVHTAVAAMPERSHDALAMHLFVPTYVADHGRWSFDVTTYRFAVMPIGGDLLYTVNYVLGGENAAKLCNLTLFMVGLWLLWTELRRHVDSTLAVLALGTLVSTPLAVFESSTLFVEHPLSAFMLGSFAMAMRAIAAPDRRLVTAACFLMATTLATKLHGALVVVPLLTVLIVFCVRRLGTRAGLALATLGVFVMAVGLEPYLNAWLRTGNPVFPNFNAIFKSPFYLPENPVDLRWAQGIKVRTLYDMTFRSGLFSEGGRGAFGFQLVMFGLAGAGAALMRGATSVRVALLIVATYIVGVCVNINYIRYLYPVFPLATLVIAGGWRTPHGGRPAAWYRMSVIVLAVAAIALNVMFIPSSDWTLREITLSAAYDQSVKDELVRQAAPERVLVSRVNALSHGRARVAFFGTPLAAGLQGEAIHTNQYNFAFQKATHEATSSADVRRAVRRERVDYAIVDETTVGKFPFLRRFLDSNASMVARVSTRTLYRIEPVRSMTDPVLDR